MHAKTQHTHTHPNSLLDARTHVHTQTQTSTQVLLSRLLLWPEASPTLEKEAKKKLESFVTLFWPPSSTKRTENLSEDGFFTFSSLLFFSLVASLVFFSLHTLLYLSLYSYALLLFTDDLGRRLLDRKRTLIYFRLFMNQFDELFNRFFLNNLYFLNFPY